MGCQTYDVKIRPIDEPDVPPDLEERIKKKLISQGMFFGDIHAKCKAKEGALEGEMRLI